MIWKKSAKIRVIRVISVLKNENMDLLEIYSNSEDKLLHKELTDKIISCFYQVYNDLGYGFLERVYQNALYYVLCDEGLDCEPEKPIKVYHNGRVVGDYRADLLVENKVLLELKSSEELSPANEKQLINYLKATDIEVGLLLNFGKRPQFKRKVFSNKNK
jgi:GxxExxY protein